MCEQPALQESFKEDVLQRMIKFRTWRTRGNKRTLKKICPLLILRCSFQSMFHHIWCTNACSEEPFFGSVDCEFLYATSNLCWKKKKHCIFSKHCTFVAWQIIAGPAIDHSCVDPLRLSLFSQDSQKEYCRTLNNMVFGICPP